MTSDIAVRHPHNPDPFFDGCQATGNVEPGVSFPYVEPQDGTIMFLGETAMIEAMSVLFDLSPDQVRARLSKDPSPKQAELNAANRTIAKLEEELVGWHSLRDAMAETGLLVTAFDS